jgi:hypothetical protein
MRLVARLLLAAALAGCSAPAPGVRTWPLPAWAVTACASVPGLPASCARRQPWAPGGESILLITRASPRHPFSSAVLQDPGGEVVSAAGPAARAARAFGLSPAVRRPVRAWLRPRGGRAFDAGPRRWNGLAGRLFLTRSGGPSWFRDLVAFTWRDGGQRRMIAIETTAGYARAVAALRAIVAERPRAAATVRELVPAPPVAGIAMVRTPRWVRLLCRGRWSRACPAVLPRPGAAGTLVQVAPHSLDVAWGGESGHAGLDRPPALVHLTVSDGHAGCFSDHICHRWSAGGRRLLVSLHAWTPSRRARAVLAAVVRSIPA